MRAPPLAEKHTTEYFECLALLGVDTIDKFPKASEHIGEIVDLCQGLIDNGFAYATNGNVWFDVTRDGDYGKLSHRKVEEQASGLRDLEGQGKRHPADFALWKAAKPGEPQWDSPWGPGRPGWHIECSAMALRELGTTTIDLHGGATDLIYPHHECEAAQSEAATGQPVVRHWLHAPLVSYDGTKMSKSLGNLVFVSDLLKEWEPQAIRLAVLGHHYRSGWEWNDELMPAAAERLDRWREAPASGDDGGLLDQVRAAIDDDLDTATALKLVDEGAAARRPVTDAAALLGVTL
jgi:L-cysteine:1D-myo-inositol 2-amino-2-deoxy-alpha-D-glucopyranoside ligase